MPIATLMNPWGNKKIYALGSAATPNTFYGTTYTSLLQSKLGLSSIVNLGLEAATLGTPTTPNSETYRNGIYYSAQDVKSDADAVIIEAGINDFRMSTPLGVNGDNSLDTYCGALRKTIDVVKSKAPNAKIIVLTAYGNTDYELQGRWNIPNELDLYLKEYNKATKIVAQANGCIVIDMAALLPFNPRFEEQGASPNTVDGIFLNSVGAETYATVLEGRMRFIGYSLRKLVYVPIDDRPCNNERVIGAARAMGVELIMPHNDMIMNRLDDQPTSSFDDRHWKSMYITDFLEAYSYDADIKGYILSMDHLLSGGLIYSRTNMSDYQSLYNERETIEKVLGTSTTDGLVGNKPVYLIDSVMRLASTVGKDGYDMDLYEATRNYGSVRRAEFSTFNDIINNYGRGVGMTAGQTIPYPGLTTAQRDEYLNARRRKFKLTDIILSNLAVNKNRANMFYMCGVDDSASPYTIQTNEINYIKKKFNGFQGRIFAGTDELAMCLLSRFAVSEFAPWTAIGARPTVRTVYYGPGRYEQADSFDYQSLETVVNNHIELANGVQTENPANIDCLILTKGASESDVTRLVNQMNTSINGYKQTIVIDASNNDNLSLNYKLTMLNNKNVGKLLAYSSWNTVGNMTGLALGHGIGRYIFMNLGPKGDANKAAAEGQVLLLFQELAKDIVYKSTMNRDAGSPFRVHLAERLGTGTTSNSMNILLSNFYTEVPAAPVDVVLAHTVYALEDCMEDRNYPNLYDLRACFLDNYVFDNYSSAGGWQTRAISWVNIPSESATRTYKFPWHRAFEITIPCKVSFK